MSYLFRSIKRSLTGLVLLSLVMVAGAMAAPAEEDNRSVYWLTYHQAMAAGQNQDKPILLHFAMLQSTICSDMRRVTYRDLKVIKYLNENFAVAVINPEELPSLARKYEVTSQSVLWFLDSSGKALTSIEGKVGPEKMLRVTKYINEKIYEHTDYNTWLDKQSTR